MPSQWASLPGRRTADAAWRSRLRQAITAMPSISRPSDIAR